MALVKRFWFWWVGVPAFEPISDESRAQYEVSEGPR